MSPCTIPSRCSASLRARSADIEAEGKVTVGSPSMVLRPESAAEDFMPSLAITAAKLTRSPSVSTSTACSGSAEAPE